MKEPFTKASGIWVDPLAKYGCRIEKSTPAKVGDTVGMLRENVIEQVNNMYSFDPPLDSKDMVVHRYTDLDSDDDLHNEKDSDGLVVLVHPKIATAKRVRGRFHTLQQAEKRTTGLIRFIRDSEVTFNSEDGGMDDLTSLFKSLLKDMSEQKADIARLKEERKADSASHKEETARLKEERKADSASHKEETARLYRLLLLEEKKREDENKNLTTETKQLRAALTDERKERMEVVADLEETIEQQGAKLEEFERRLKNVNEQHDKDIRDISELTQKIVPIHLRILLDYGRERILEFMNYKSWDELRDGRNISLLTDLILKRLHEVNVDRLSRETVVFLCSYNNVRKEGDRVAHNATQNDIKDAVIMQKNSQDGLKLQELYQFVFTTPI